MRSTTAPNPATMRPPKWDRYLYCPHCRARFRRMTHRSEDLMPISGHRLLAKHIAAEHPEAFA